MGKYSIFKEAEKARIESRISSAIRSGDSKKLTLKETFSYYNWP